MALPACAARVRALIPILVVALSTALTAPAGRAQCPTVEHHEVHSIEGIGPRRFGFAVAMDGDLMVVGAHFDSTLGLQWAGAAYVYRWDGHRWRDEQKLFPSDPEWFMLFGRGVAVWDGTIVVSAPDKPVNGKKNAGKAYIFEHDGTEWVETQTIVASNPGYNQFFGRTLVMQGGRILISAPNYNIGPNPGQAYIFEDNGAGWTQVQRIQPKDGAPGDRFGYGLALHDDRAVIGAYLDDDAGVDAGSVYFYRHNGTRFRQKAKALAPDGAAGDEFGYQVALHGNVALAGANGHDLAGNDAGAAYVYQLDAGAWSFQQKLLPPRPIVDGVFGHEVAASEGWLVVGAFEDDGGAPTSGAAYTYRRDGLQWDLQQKLLGSEGVTGDQFAYSLAVQDHRVVAGAPADADLGFLSGAVYYFELAPFTLEVSPETVHAGENVDLRVAGGEPGARLLLTVVEIDDVPWFQPILQGRFRGDGHWSLQRSVPPGLEGLIGLQLFSPDACGCLRATSRAMLRVL